MYNQRLPSTSQQHFSMVPDVSIPRSTFDRSHGYKTTLNSGYLVPIFGDEALPGDTFTLGMTHFARMTTPLVPFMDNVFFDVFFFAVPNRLLWNNWQKFCGEQTDPGDSIDYLVPTVTSPVGGYDEMSLQDYFGLPTKVAGLEHANLIPRAYNLIWNEWFRDENLQDSVVVDKDDGPDDPADYVLLRRCKIRDYFTSCLPWTQKGTAPLIPIGDAAPVLTSSTDQVTGAQTELRMALASGAAFSGSSFNMRFIGTSGTSGAVYGESLAAGTGNNPVYPKNLYADLSQASAVTVNELREAFQIQRLLEREARGGTRYTEIVRSMFGVTSPDSRLQRPEYLGGYSSPINVNPIAQTSSTDGTTPQGNLAAVGTSAKTKGLFSKSFTEHCIVIGLVNIRADLTYQQGLNRMWSRSTKLDYYWPPFAHLGEQAVYNREIYCDASANDALVFGYQERYGEYRYKSSQVTGQFRSNSATPLDTWHLSQDFASLPVLNNSFIESTPPISRVIAVPTYPEFFLDTYFNFKCTRPMPVYSVPGLIDHF